MTLRISKNSLKLSGAESRRFDFGSFDKIETLRR